jgi:hypothetical protein
MKTQPNFLPRFKMKVFLLDYLKFPIILIILFFHTLTVLSQSSVFNAYAVFSDTARAASSLQGTFYINEVDTLNTSQLEISVGISEGDTSAVYQVVDFDNGAGLPTGFSYSRNGDRIAIEVSAAAVLWTYHCSVRIKDSGGVWGIPLHFITN